MIMGVEKKTKDKEELDSTFTSRSHISDNDELGGSSSDHCKDVDVVSVLPECSTSATARSYRSDKVADRGKAAVSSRHRILEESSVDYDSGHKNMSVSSSLFEFQKAERAPQRMPLGPFSKRAPSKWDDAQKWIASPTSNRPKAGQTQGQSEKAGSRKLGTLGFGRQSSLKLVVEVPDQIVVASEEPDTKRIDTKQTKMESGGQEFVTWEAEPYATGDSYGYESHRMWFSGEGFGSFSGCLNSTLNAAMHRRKKKCGYKFFYK